MSSIPRTATQSKMEIYSKVAGSHRLDKFGDFGIIDNLVRSYGGTYTHDDIFELDVIMVHNMLLLAKEVAYVESGTQEAQRQAKN